MRLHLRTTPSTSLVPFDHLHWLAGALHKWLGPRNRWHDGHSLYAVGWLQGGRPRSNALTFPEGARWRLSFFEDEAARRIQVGILQDASLFAGMHVLEVREQHTPAFSGPHRFKVDSPVVVRTRRDDGSREYLTYDNPMSDRLLTRGLQAKMRLAGLGDEHTGGWVRFDRQYRGARTKLATIRKGRHAVRHKASLCPVVVGGTPQAARFAWNVGVGHLTGSGFGALR